MKLRRNIEIPDDSELLTIAAPFVNSLQDLSLLQILQIPNIKIIPMENNQKRNMYALLENFYIKRQEK